MITLNSSACIDAPLALVWARLAALEDIPLWTDAIRAASITSEARMGVGAERTCELHGNHTLTERVVAWDDGRSFTYESTTAPFMKLARNTWSVEAHGPGRTLVTSQAEVTFKGGPFGRLLEIVFGPLLARVFPNPFAKFKFWVETGHPFQGNARKLPTLAPGC
jgi:hypothetical protein